MGPGIESVVRELCGPSSPGGSERRACKSYKKSVGRWLLEGLFLRHVPVNHAREYLLSQLFGVFQSGVNRDFFDLHAQFHHQQVLGDPPMAHEQAVVPGLRECAAEYFLHEAFPKKSPAELTAGPALLVPNRQGMKESAGG
jgi:hypothetical protein